MVTKKDLQNKLMLLNKLTNSPITPYSESKSNVRNFHLYFAYGKVSLVRFINVHGGVSTIIEFTTKKDLFKHIESMIKGIYFINPEKQKEAQSITFYVPKTRRRRRTRAEMEQSRKETTTKPVESNA